MSATEYTHAQRVAIREERRIWAEKYTAAQEQGALRFTPNEWKMLLETFSSVKTEFSDLDGQVWTQADFERTERERLQLLLSKSVRQVSTTLATPPPPPTLSVPPQPEPVDVLWPENPAPTPRPSYTIHPSLIPWFSPVPSESENTFKPSALTPCVTPTMSYGHFSTFQSQIQTSDIITSSPRRRCSSLRRSSSRLTKFSRFTKSMSDLHGNDDSIWIESMPKVSIDLLP